MSGTLPNPSPRLVLRGISMLPYAATIVVLAIICRDPKAIRLNQPASLGASFHPDA
jgi:ABC-type uncharacterized transport system permease subunit